MAAAKSLQSCPTLCDPIVGSPLGSPVPGILQARTLEWVAISFSNAWKWKVKVKSLSRVGLLATPWTAAYQAPPSMGFSRQECWSGVPLPCPKYTSGDADKSKHLNDKQAALQMQEISCHQRGNERGDSLRSGLLRDAASKTLVRKHTPSASSCFLVLNERHPCT